MNGASVDGSGLGIFGRKHVAPAGRQSSSGADVAPVDWLAGMLLVVLAVDLSQDAVRIVQRRCSSIDRVSSSARSRPPATELDDAHSSTIEIVEEASASDREHGLTEAEAQSRLAQFGPNRLEQAHRPPYLRIAARQFMDPLVGLLVVAAFVSFALGESIEGAVIAVIVLVNGVLGFVQEARAEHAVLALRSSLEPKATVVRGGRERELAVDLVVPGDVLVLREGERVPADGRVVSAAGLAVDESTLTGESVPVDKDVGAVARRAPLGDRASMVYAGTAVTRGRGTLLVTATGSATELGRIAGLTERAKPPPTPLQRRVGGLTRVMVLVGVVVTLALSGAMLADGESLQDAFLVGVSVAVAAVPEGLVATVTIALALGARAMAERGAIVRRLVAVEALGSATVVASDKTGTLTENRLRLAGLAPTPGNDEVQLISAAALASSARVIEDEGSTRVAGDPVDAALVLAAHERGLSTSTLFRDRRLVREVPFDPTRKLMTLLFEEADGMRAYVKGAPEVVLARSTATEEEAGAIEEQAHAWAREGLRVLAVASAIGHRSSWTERTSSATSWSRVSWHSTTRCGPRPPQPSHKRARPACGWRW